MDRTHRPVIETRAIEDRRNATHTGPGEIRQSDRAPQAESCNSGVLRELAEQMRHWD